MSNEFGGRYGTKKVVMMKNGILVMRFDCGQGKIDEFQGGIYHFDNKGKSKRWMQNHS